MLLTAQDFPTRNRVFDDLGKYEQRYALPIRRSTLVDAVERTPDGLIGRAGDDAWQSQAVVSATGNWRHPHAATYPGCEAFKGQQLHSARYVSAAPFASHRSMR